jgi:hypothetical protein
LDFEHAFGRDDAVEVEPVFFRVCWTFLWPSAGCLGLGRAVVAVPTIPAVVAVVAIPAVVPVPTVVPVSPSLEPICALGTVTAFTTVVPVVPVAVRRGRSRFSGYRSSFVRARLPAGRWALIALEPLPLPAAADVVSRAPGLV